MYCKTTYLSTLAYKKGLMSIRNLYITFAIIILACSCSNMGGNMGANAPEFKIDYEKYQLDNGLDVILHQDKSDPIVSVAILFNVGSNREKPGRTGFAHFFEHMLFQNSENVGKGNFFKSIEDLGGNFNGGTWRDGTIYYETIPNDALERILWMEADRMGFMINTVTVPVLENEKQVVKNEKRQRVDNQPYGHTSYVIDKAIYPEGHPYNWQVIGSLEDLQAATIDDVKEFYDKWYGPNNATMVIAGDFDPEEVKTMVEKYFGEIPSKGEPTPMAPQPVAIDKTIKLMHEDNFAQLPEMRMVWPAVEDGHPDSYALSFLGQILSQGKRAPLYKVIVEDENLAPSASSFFSPSELAGTFNIRVRANPNTDLDIVLFEVEQALLMFEENEIDSRDMERIKNRQETSFYNGLSSVFGKSFQLADANIFDGSPDALKDQIKNILAVKKEDVRRVYDTYIKDKPYVLPSFVPMGQASLAVDGSQIAEVIEEEIVQGAEAMPLPEGNESFEKTPSAIDRSIIPALGEAPVVKEPEIWTATLSNGLKVYGITNEELPLVNFSLRIKGGKLLDAAGKAGTANLITDVMMEGTANKTPEQLQDAIGQLGANLGMFTSPEFIQISGNCLSRKFDDTYTLFEEILLEPRWDANEFERLKVAALTGIKQRAGQPNTIASLVFSKLIYGADSPMAMPTSGMEETVSTISLDDLKAFYDGNFSPSVSSFHVAGNITKQQVMKSLESLAANWESTDVSLPEMPMAVSTDQPQVYFVDIPAAKQSVLYIGMPSITGNDEDFAALNFVNQRLGGGTSSRLFQQLREEKGYTYGVYSGVPRRQNQSFFATSSSVRSNVTLESAALIRDILSSYPEEYNEEDLEKTKNNILKGNALDFETLGDKIGILENISTFNLPIDYFKQEEKVTMDMSLDQAKGLIRKYMDPSKMIYVVVGDANTQADRLKELGFGDVVMLDKEGQPVTPVPN
ncbi:MAG: insulinase family protein [Saprospiraceae bacterium]|nr:insulinase family protein [Saprospiraceae bacterium]